MQSAVAYSAIACMQSAVAYSAIACILSAYVLQFVAALYASTDSAGTYITRFAGAPPQPNKLLPKAGGVVALQVNDVKAEQLLNDLSRMYFIFGPKSTVVRLVHDPNA